MPGALSARHVHALVAAPVRVVRKKLINCKIDFGGMECRGGGLTPHRTSGRQSPATRGENADAPHQSTPM